MTARLIGNFLGTVAASALFGAAIASAVEWVLTGFIARGPRTIALSCVAAFFPLSVLLMNDPKFGFWAPAAVALGCSIVWWLRVRAWAKRSRGGNVAGGGSDKA